MIHNEFFWKQAQYCFYAWKSNRKDHEAQNLCTYNNITSPPVHFWREGCPKYKSTIKLSMLTFLSMYGVHMDTPFSYLKRWWPGGKAPMLWQRRGDWGIAQKEITLVRYLHSHFHLLQTKPTPTSTGKEGWHWWNWICPTSNGGRDWTEYWGCVYPFINIGFSSITCRWPVWWPWREAPRIQ